MNMKGRNLSKDEERAVRRFRQAKEERESAFKKDDLSEQERRKVLALTQPGLAFWSSKGYRTFHLRNCPKLAGLTDLAGFPRYQDAVSAGYKPCRFCKPSKKHDVAYSIPITNQVRKNETVDMLCELCKKNDLPWDFNGSIFSLQTAVGKWRIYTNIRPVKLEHINLVYNPGNTEKYHVQPRLFLSLVDTFEYILRHDQQLLAKQQNSSTLERVTG
jgi:hypothetical protein